MTANNTIIKCKGLLFDMDGTLVDCTPCVEKHWTNFCRTHGINEKELLSNCHGVRTVETLRRYAPNLATDEIVNELEARAGFDTDGVIPIVGVPELLPSLIKNTWAIVTSASRPVAEFRLNHQRYPLPEILITADEVTNGKPHPEGYLLAAKKLNIAPSECVVFEDATAGIDAASNAGMKSIGILTSHTKDRLVGAALHIQHFNELNIIFDPISEYYTISLKEAN
ncbi:hypothetical protein K7432_016525 [Basidiobolus ranarum]|uniref:Uncharacterized protein n=1 Tax=Basidiobolus ranarum TaxID=34480 RepID=A0ABR2VLI8_9FUNG